MTNAATKNEIIRRFYSGQSMRGVARELHVSRKTVRRVVDEHERDRKEAADTSHLPVPRKRRGSQVDEYEDTMRELLARYPDITATRVLQELRSAGYTGGYTILRERVNELRPRPSPTELANCWTQDWQRSDHVTRRPEPMSRLLRSALPCCTRCRAPTHLIAMRITACPGPNAQN